MLIRVGIVAGLTVFGSLLCLGLFECAVNWNMEARIA
jgi:hypothetical protein